MAQAKVSERPPLASIVGANVYRLRVLRLPKMSQGQLARAAGVAVNTVAMVEAARDPARRQNSVRLDTMEALADALGVDPSDLLAWDEATRGRV
ncbi:MAG: helix-turn-helix domain-containing protein [Actinomycetota bacterium]